MRCTWAVAQLSAVPYLASAASWYGVAPNLSGVPSKVTLLIPWEKNGWPSGSTSHHRPPISAVRNAPVASNVMLVDPP